MTYCVGLSLDRGLVFMSDTRTNAGVDNFSVTRKMFTFEVPGERFITIMTAGKQPCLSRGFSMGPWPPRGSNGLPWPSGAAPCGFFAIQKPTR